MADHYDKYVEAEIRMQEEAEAKEALLKGCKLRINSSKERAQLRKAARQRGTKVYMLTPVGWVRISKSYLDWCVGETYWVTSKEIN
tara:strand:+ start:896 stop:1153 length:258 start_codon:yes stop_codon:yes gene_type:complete